MNNKITKNDIIKTFEYIFTDENAKKSVYELLNRMTNEIQNVKLFIEAEDSDNIFESLERLGQFERALKQKFISRTLYTNGIFEKP